MKERKNHWCQDINGGDEKSRSLSDSLNADRRKNVSLPLNEKVMKEELMGKKFISYKGNRLDNWAWIKGRSMGTNNGKESLIWKKVRQKKNLELTV